MEPTGGIGPHKRAVWLLLGDKQAIHEHVHVGAGGEKGALHAVLPEGEDELANPPPTNNVSYFLPNRGHRETSRERSREQPREQNRCLRSHRELPDHPRATRSRDGKEWVRIVAYLASMWPA
jgi:hypothetical protein